MQIFHEPKTDTIYTRFHYGVKEYTVTPTQYEKLKKRTHAIDVKASEKEGSTVLKKRKVSETKQKPAQLLSRRVKILEDKITKLSAELKKLQK